MTGLSEDHKIRLKRLFPTLTAPGEAEQLGLETLLNAEEWRSGATDKLTGAFHPWFLTQGQLLKNEYDLSTHGHHDEWKMGAVVVDPIALMLVNDHFGFSMGDRLLQRAVQSMQSSVPKAKVVRIHSDGFAILCGPTSEQNVDVTLVESIRSSLHTSMTVLWKGQEAEQPPPKWTIGAMNLYIQSPSHWQVLGPLVWAECERTLTLFKRFQAQGIVERHINLNGALPES